MTKDTVYKALCLVLLIMTALTGCSRSSTGRQVSHNMAAAPSTGEQYTPLTGVVVKNDLEKRQITLQELGSDIQTTLNYDATTAVMDAYGSAVYGEDVEPGEIMEAGYRQDNGLIVTMQVPEDVWEYKEVTDYRIDNSEKSIELAQRKYQYSSQTYIGSSGQDIEMMELNSSDVLTVRGVGYTAYSIVRTRGHGYIRLKNYRDFIGGMIEVGNDVILPITKNMLITVREGSYKVILCKGAMSAVKNVMVRLDEEVTVDFSDYQPAAQRIGTVEFKIDPAGADLTINGAAVDYSKPLPLLYGSYRIAVTMTGYESYSGMLKVGAPSKTVRIDLIDEDASITETTEGSSDRKGNDDDDSTEETKQMDSGHTITVSAPVGAEVYLDNVYKGLAPCTFTKIMGTQTITLRKEGYTTKSYSVDILDDGEDVSLSFSELVAAATASPSTQSTGTAQPTSSSGEAKG